MKASLGTLVILEGGNPESSSSLDATLPHPLLEEDSEASYGLKTTRLGDVFPPRMSTFNTKGRVNLFLKFTSF